MFKYILSTVILTVAMFCTVFPSTAYPKSLEESLCIYVAEDDKKRFRNVLKTNKVKARTVFEAVQCNNQNLLLFADSHSSVRVGSMLISKLPKDTVEENLSKLKEVYLQNKAKKRIE